MGRGTSENSSSALLYGPVRRNPDARFDPSTRAERAFTRHLLGALDAGDEVELHSFLCSEAACHLPIVHDPYADAYAMQAVELLIGKTPLRPGGLVDDHELLNHQTRVAAFIARAGGRLSPDIHERLVETWITSDLKCGRGYTLLEDHMDVLMRRTGLERTVHRVIHRQWAVGPHDRKQASHYAHVDHPTPRVACGKTMTSLRMHWVNDATGDDLPTCKACRKLGRSDSPKILTEAEDTPRLIRRRFESISERARARVGNMASTASTMDPREFTDAARKQAWLGVMNVIAEACNQADHPLDRTTMSRLHRFWDPEGSPTRDPGLMPAVAL